MPTIAEAAAEEARAILHRLPNRHSSSIPLLYLAWKTCAWLTPAALEEIAALTGLSPATVEGIAGFYTMFPLHPRGKYHIEICDNISCYINGAPDLKNHLRNKLGIEFGQTTSDGRFTLDHVECLGNCCEAPCMQINGKEYGRLTVQKINEILDSLD
ncbi:MAG TPA: NADH-quinone oxidoreductase subunit NuoE [bacterium]|mgnify:FL=1|nr:NADH-quinone oxidoreductase subunit NuoE [bacterium]HQL61358.1 NADH-quinone oxidoreductase subunit NuoE [bacterium]